MTATPGERTETRGWSVDDSSFGARLALVRLRMDWNLKEAAAECRLPAASWRTWERDGVTPRRIIEVATIIATRTGCSFNWLLFGPERDGQAIRVTSPMMVARIGEHGTNGPRSRAPRTDRVSAASAMRPAIRRMPSPTSVGDGPLT